MTEWPSNRLSGERYGIRSSTDHLPSSGDHHVSFVDEDVVHPGKAGSRYYGPGIC